MSDRARRREIAKDALDVSGWPGIDDDPYWLTNLHGRVNTDDMWEMAERLQEDADLIADAAHLIEEDELLPEEAALLIAEDANYGDYDTHNDMYDSLPLQVENPEAQE